MKILESWGAWSTTQLSYCWELKSGPNFSNTLFSEGCKMTGLTLNPADGLQSLTTIGQTKAEVV